MVRKISPLREYRGELKYATILQDDEEHHIALKKVNSATGKMDGIIQQNSNRPQSSCLELFCLKYHRRKQAKTLSKVHTRSAYYRF